jgi:hypothetical protein
MRAESGRELTRYVTDLLRQTDILQVCIVDTHVLDQGSEKYSLPRAALAIHIFVDGPQKEINNVVYSLRNVFL